MLLILVWKSWLANMHRIKFMSLFMLKLCSPNRWKVMQFKYTHLKFRLKKKKSLFYMLYIMQWHSDISKCCSSCSTHFGETVLICSINWWNMWTVCVSVSLIGHSVVKHTPVHVAPLLHIIIVLNLIFLSSPEAGDQSMHVKHT